MTIKSYSNFNIGDIIGYKGDTYKVTSKIGNGFGLITYTLVLK